jgi:hypothetical protein
MPAPEAVAPGQTLGTPLGLVTVMRDPGALISTSGPQQSALTGSRIRISPRSTKDSLATHGRTFLLIANTATHCELSQGQKRSGKTICASRVAKRARPEDRVDETGLEAAPVFRDANQRHLRCSCTVPVGLRIRRPVRFVLRWRSRQAPRRPAGSGGSGRRNAVDRSVDRRNVGDKR